MFFQSIFILIVVLIPTFDFWVFCQQPLNGKIPKFLFHDKNFSLSFKTHNASNLAKSFVKLKSKIQEVQFAPIFKLYKSVGILIAFKKAMTFHRNLEIINLELLPNSMWSGARSAPDSLQAQVLNINDNSTSKCWYSWLYLYLGVLLIFCCWRIHMTIFQRTVLKLVSLGIAPTIILDCHKSFSYIHQILENIMIIFFP